MGVDPDANPLLSFGRDDDFTDELIKGVCEKNESKPVAPKKSIVQPGAGKAAQGQDEDGANDKKRNIRKKRRGIC